MSKKHILAGLTPLEQIIINEPTQRFILWIIANDREAFSIHFILELTKQKELLQPGKAPNLVKALAIHQNLLKKKMINNGNPLKTKITWRGQFYRFFTHPAFPLIALLFGALVTISLSLATCKHEPIKNSIQSLAIDSASKGVGLDFNSKQIVLARIIADKETSYNGYIGIIVYSMVLVNKSKDFITVKNALLQFDFDGKRQSEEALNLITGIVKDTTNGIEKPSLKFEVKHGVTVYIEDWYNLREKINEGKLLHPGEILKGSAYYLLPITDTYDLNRIKNVSISIIDYSGNKTDFPIDLINQQPIRVWEFKSNKFIQQSN